MEYGDITLADLIFKDKYSKLPGRFFVEFALSILNEIRDLTVGELEALRTISMWLEGKATIEQLTLSHINLCLLPADGRSSMSTPIYYLTCATIRDPSRSDVQECLSRTIVALKVKDETPYIQRFLDKVNNLTKVEKVLYGIR